MRLLFERGFAPTHAFSAFYRYLREDFGADVVLHFGMHGALEFMPGKQAGLSGACWPERLIGALPHVYLYAANNPSEGALAKRRSAATLISYLTPSLAHAGLYRGLVDLKASIDRFRAMEPDDERSRLAELIQSQAAAIDLAKPEPAWDRSANEEIAQTERGDPRARIHAYSAWSACRRRSAGSGRARGNPHGDRRSFAIASRRRACRSRAGLRRLGRDGDPGLRRLADAGNAPGASSKSRASMVCSPKTTNSPPCCAGSTDGSSPPSPAAISSRTPAILPTGRNLHGFDPYRIPSAFAIADGARQAERVLARHACRRSPISRIGRDCSVGYRQPQERRRSDWPGAGAPRRAAAIRRLWPPVRRGAGSPRRAQSAPHRHRRHGVRNLSRSLAIASAASGGSVLPRRHSGRAAGQKQSAQARARTSGQERLRHRDSGLARLQ